MTPDSEILTTVRLFVTQQFLPGETPEALSSDTPLIEGGILDSLATLKLVSFLESTYDIELEAHELGPDNLGTLKDIVALVKRKRES